VSYQTNIIFISTKKKQCDIKLTSTYKKQCNIKLTCRGAHEMISRRADSISNSSRLVNETSQLVSTKGPELEGWIRDRLVTNRASSLARLQLVSRLEFIQLISQYNFNNYEYKFI
jgi:hypothetical protein